MLVPAWVGRQGAEAALVSSGATVPHSPNNQFSSAGRLPTCRDFFEPTLFTPKPTGGHPTHISTSGGFPPQKKKANMYHTRKYQPAYWSSVYGTPPPLPWPVRQFPGQKKVP